MIPRRHSLSLEELGDRNLPSGSGITTTAVGGAAIVAPATHHPLKGTGTAAYHQPRITVDTGMSLSFLGHGQLSDIGAFRISGSINGVGLINNGRAVGELVLKNAHGTITINVHGSVQPSFAPIPRDLVYVVAKGTGDFQHLTGYGSLKVTLIPAIVGHNQAPRGTINLIFS
jgi:hypothetical protein